MSKDSASKKIGRFLSKKAIDASKIAFDKTKQMTTEELKKVFGTKDLDQIEVVRPQRPSNTGRVQFVSRTKPVRTYTRGVRTVEFMRKNPEKEVINPSLDGLVSFSLLLAPFALLVGIGVLTNIIGELFALILLFLWIIFIAIPGAYLGLDGIMAGTKSVLTGGFSFVKGFAEFIFFFVQGFIELIVIFLTACFGFAKDAFQTLADYIVFGVVYILFATGIWFMIVNLQLETKLSSSFFLLSMLVLLPALLPASIAHRYYLIWKINRQTVKYHN